MLRRSESLVNAFKLLASQQMGGDSLVEVLAEGHQERSRLETTEELRRFIMVDHHLAVNLLGSSGS